MSIKNLVYNYDSKILLISKTIKQSIHLIIRIKSVFRFYSYT